MARTPSPSSFDHPLSHSSLPNHHNPHQLIWTPAHEERLLLVQTQLSKAQKEWSEDQDLWLEEVRLSCFFLSIETEDSFPQRINKYADGIAALSLGIQTPRPQTQVQKGGQESFAASC